MPLRLLINHTIMNTTFDTQSGAYPLPSRVSVKCRPLEDLWKGGRYAHGEIIRMSKQFFEAVTSLENKSEETMKHLESLFFRLQFNWIRLDGQLRCLKDFPCQCTQPTCAIMTEYLRYGEEAWDEFCFCSELLVGVKVKTGRAIPSEGAELLRDLVHMKNFNW